MITCWTLGEGEEEEGVEMGGGGEGRGGKVYSRSGREVEEIAEGGGRKGKRARGRAFTSFRGDVCVFSVSVHAGLINTGRDAH